MRLLVTGGGGFIGSHLVEALLARGDEVACLLRRPQEQTWLRGLAVEVVPGDLARPGPWAAALDGVEAVCHLAGRTKGWGYGQANAQATANLVAACRERAKRLTRLVYLSSLAAQGPSRLGRPQGETDPCRPVSLYGQSKLAGEKAVQGLPSSVRVAVLRAPIVYGPRDRGLVDLLRAAQRGWLPLPLGFLKEFSLIHVADLIRAILLCLERPVTGVFLLADGQTHRPASLGRAAAQALGVIKARPLPLPWPVAFVAGLAAEAWGRLTGRPELLGWDKLRELHAPAWTCGLNRAREELGFRPRVDLSAGLAETVAWYRAAGWL